MPNSMNKMSMGIIYCAHCIVNDKKYIGQTINTLNIRKNKHKNASMRSKKRNKFYSAIKKYGINNFIWGIIEEVNIEKMDEREKYWIDHFSTFMCGYNSTLGGEKYYNPNSWKEFTIMSPTGKICSDKNISKFCRENDLSQGHLCSVISGKLKSHKGWKLPETKIKKRNFSAVMSPDGQVYVIENISHFCNEHNLCVSHLVKVLYGKRKHHKGYAAVDIFTCGDHTYPAKACEYMIDALQSKKPNMTIVSRGI